MPRALRRLNFARTFASGPGGPCGADLSILRTTRINFDTVWIAALAAAGLLLLVVA